MCDLSVGVFERVCACACTSAVVLCVLFGSSVPGGPGVGAVCRGCVPAIFQTYVKVWPADVAVYALKCKRRV